MGRLPAASLFKRRIKRALINNMTERYGLLPKSKSKETKVEEQIQESEYSARDKFAEHGIHGVQTRDITTFAGGRAVAVHKGQYHALKNDTVKSFNSMTDAVAHLKEEQLDEISAETKVNYAHAAFKQGNELHTQIRATLDPKVKEKLQAKLSKRNQGVIKASNSLKEESEMQELTLESYSLDEIVEFMMSEEYKQLDELSKTTLGNYIKNASMNKAQHYLDAVHAKNPVELDKSLKQAGKRVKGISAAVKKLTEEKLTEAQIEHNGHTFTTYKAGDVKDEGGVHHVYDAHTKHLKTLGVPHKKDTKYGETVRVAVKNNSTGELTQHHVYQSDFYGKKPTVSIRTFGEKSKQHEAHTKALHSFLTGSSKIQESLIEEHLTINELAKRTAKAKQIAESMGISTSVVEDIMGLLVKEAKGKTEIETDCDHDDLYSHKSDLDEASVTESTNTRSILPASQALHDKSKSTLQDIGNTWHGKTTVQVVEKQGKHYYVAGSGHTPHKEETFRGRHDQTFKDLGDHKVVNTIHLEGGKVVHKHNDIGTNKAHALYVYK